MTSTPLGDSGITCTSTLFKLAVSLIYVKQQNISIKEVLHSGQTGTTMPEYNVFSIFPLCVVLFTGGFSSLLKRNANFWAVASTDADLPLQRFQSLCPTFIFRDFRRYIPEQRKTLRLCQIDLKKSLK